MALSLCEEVYWALHLGGVALDSLLPVDYIEARGIGSAVGVALDKSAYLGNVALLPSIVSIKQSYILALGGLDGTVAGNAYAGVGLVQKLYLRVRGG